MLFYLEEPLMTIKLQKSIIVPALLVHFFLLFMIYKSWIVPYWGYSGFHFSVSELDGSIAVLTIVLMSLQIQHLMIRGNATDIIITFFNVVYFFPVCILFGFSNHDYSYFLFVCSYFLTLNILNEKINFNSSRLAVHNKEILFDLAFFLLGVAMIVISGFYTGFRISFDLSEYYEYRMQVRELSMPVLLRYVFSWTMYLLPIGLTYALTRKKMSFALFLSFCQILSFSFNGKKSVLFSFLLAYMIYFLLNNEKIRLKIPYAFCGLSAIALLEVYLRGSEAFLAKTLIRRLMFVPASLGKVYFDFFQTHEPDYMRISVFRYFGFASPYSEGLGFTIGAELSSSGDLNANTGLCGDAFANFGWIGAFLYPLLIIIAIKFMERYFTGIDMKVKASITFMVAYMFISGTYFKIFLTSGFLILLLLLMVYPNRKIENYPPI